MTQHKHRGDSYMTEIALSLTETEIISLITAITEAQRELCTGPGFDEANIYDARLETIKDRLKALIPEAKWPMEYW